MCMTSSMSCSGQCHHMCAALCRTDFNVLGMPSGLPFDLSFPFPVRQTPLKYLGWHAACSLYHGLPWQWIPLEVPLTSNMAYARWVLPVQPWASCMAALACPFPARERCIWWQARQCPCGSCLWTTPNSKQRWVCEAGAGAWKRVSMRS